MGYTDVETKEMRASVALELLRHKALLKVADGFCFVLDIEDVNECLVVAGVPLIMPDEVKAKEINVIKIQEEN